MVVRLRKRNFSFVKEIIIKPHQQYQPPDSIQLPATWQ